MTEYTNENGDPCHLTFDSTDLPSDLDGGYTLEFVGRDAGNQRSENPNQVYTGWFCTPSYCTEQETYWAQVVENGRTHWINLLAECELEEDSEDSPVEDSPADWYESTERVGDHWTVHRSSHVSYNNHHVVIVKVDAGWHPFEDRPYAVLFQNPNDGGYYEGSYDLTLEQAIHERQWRSKADSDPSWWSTLPPKFRNWDAVNSIGEERLKQAFTWGSATDKALVELLYAAFIEEGLSSHEFLTGIILPVVKEIKDELTDGFDHDWTTDRDWQETIRD